MYRIISTVSKNIASQYTQASGNNAVGIEESADFGIVISGLQIIQLRLYLVSEAILPILRDFRILQNRLFSQLFRLK
jgi:hypothetical protein